MTVVQARRAVDDLVAGARVERVVLHRVRLPLVEPLVAAHGTETHRDATLVEVGLAGGSTGWGECAALARPTYTAEYADGAYRTLRDLLVPALLTGGPPIVGHPMATAAVEAAIVDAALRAQGRSLAGALGATRSSVPMAAVVGRAPSLDALVERVGALVDRGVGAVSLKIAPGWDVEPLRALRTTWPELELAADGNGAYGGAVEALAALDRLDLHHLEQPLPADELVACAELRSRVATPIALDESIGSAGLVDAAAALGALDAVNVKPARVGGLAAALDVVDRATRHGLALYCGGMLETAIGRAAAVAFAARGELGWPTHLGPSSRYLADDLAGPIELDAEARLPVPDGPGIGVEPVPERLDEVVVDRAVLER